MFNWIFKNRFAGRKDEVRSAAADLARERRNIGLWNNPVPDYSRVAPSPMLRNQARYLVANNAVAARAAQAFVDNVIGPGITLLPKIGDPALKALLLKRWNRWTEASDADGMLNWYGQQALAVRSMFVDGEVFVRMLADSDGMLRLQLLPAEFIDTTITRDNVIAGIEFEGARAARPITSTSGIRGNPAACRGASASRRPRCCTSSGPRRPASFAA
jgi:capsid protein